MLKNYIKTAWRNLTRNKVFALINILGLATGLAFVLLTAAYVWSEVQVNTNLRDSDRTYLVQSRWKDPSMGFDFCTLGPLAKTLKHDYPGLVKEYYHLDGVNSIVSKGDKHFSERLQIGDTSFFRMFGFSLLHGDPQTAFRYDNSVVILAKNARKYLGRTDVVGQTLTIRSFSGDKKEFQITGVLKDPPYNTIMSYGMGTDELFLPASSLRFFGRDAGFDQWTNPYLISYVQLQKGVDPASLQKPVEQLIKANTPDNIQKNLRIEFTPVKQYYLRSDNGLPYRMIWSLSIVAFFILFMAIVNFVNISMGNSVQRLREIGVRKVMGSTKKQLILQFLTESLLLTALAMGLALLIYSLTRSIFSNIMGKELPGLTQYPFHYIIIPVGMTGLIGFLAGIYPAFVLSGQRSVESLKGKLETIKEKVFFRFSLSTLQFVTAIVVFVVAIVINQQVSFFFNSDLGYSKEAVITARVPRDWTPKGVQHMTAIRNSFITMPQVASASFSYEIPDGGNSGNLNLCKAGQDSTQGISAGALTTDEKYAETYKIPVIAGSFFNASGGFPDSSAVVLNESAVKALGWKNAKEAIGQKVRIQYGGQLTVAGIVKDFHFGSFQENIRPELFMHVRSGQIYRFLSFKLRAGNLADGLAAIQKRWSVLLPDAPFDYTFMDDNLARLYEKEIQLKEASKAATILALVIVLLGVFGMVTQNMARRAKEMGIRKVLGASVLQVITLFAREFSLVMLLANLIAWPVGWLIVHNWLNNYAYRVNLTLLPFFQVSLALVVLVAVLIGFRTLRTALANPVQRLRTD